MLTGAVLAAGGLAFFAYAGFAPAGHFPWLTALVFATGVILVALCRAEISTRSTAGSVSR
jgi:formate/nitrite transporter FocA (FNT family)